MPEIPQNRLYSRCCVMMPYLLGLSSSDCLICSHLSWALQRHDGKNGPCSRSLFIYFLASFGLLSHYGHVTDWQRYECPLWPHTELISITQYYCAFSHFKWTKEAEDGLSSYFPDMIEMTWLLWEILNAWPLILITESALPLTVSFKCFPSLPASAFMSWMRLQQKSLKVKSCA